MFGNCESPKHLHFFVLLFFRGFKISSCKDSRQMTYFRGILRLPFSVLFSLGSWRQVALITRTSGRFVVLERWLIFLCVSLHWNHLVLIKFDYVMNIQTVCGGLGRLEGGEGWWVGESTDDSISRCCVSLMFDRSICSDVVLFCLLICFACYCIIVCALEPHSNRRVQNFFSSLFSSVLFWVFFSVFCVCLCVKGVL